MTTIDLVKNKSYEERLHMRNNMIAYRITKENESYIGTAADLISMLNISSSQICQASLISGCAFGWKIERLGMYKKVYKVYKDNELVFKGYVEDVAKKLFMSEMRVVQLANHDVLADRQYSIKYDGDIDLVEMKV